MNIKEKAATAVGMISLVVGGATNAAAGTSFAFGPIERLSTDSVTVLGQRYAVKNLSLAEFSIGSYVLIEGEANAIGALGRTVKRAKGLYVPGASDVALAGVVRNYDSANGFLTIGALSVYVVDAVAAKPVELKAGVQIEVVGRQSVPFGQVWATEIRVVSNGRETPSTAAQAIEGTGRAAKTQAIEGTGRSLSTNAIEGTGKLASKQSIEGTGKLSATQAIEGTGRIVSVQAIEGTGRASSTQAIEGTGKSASPQAIEGTGKTFSIQAIEGTGKSATTSAIEGTGKSVKTQAIEGTGRSASTQAIEGTGRSATTQAIEGTGRTL